jgi:hypothetical protein
MTISGIDHVVVIDADLEQLVRRYENLGFRVTPGGVHAQATTHNALIPFQDGSYIELIAFQEGKGSGRRAELLAKGGGLIEYMLTSNAIELDLAQARHHRLPYDKPVPGSRTRPDGAEVEWLDGPLTVTGSGLPALIQDVTDREMRVPPSAARQHPNGATGISNLIIAVMNIDHASLLYQRLLVSDAEMTRLTSEFIEAAFLVGDHRLTLRQPLDFGPLEVRVKRLGEGPIAVELTGSTARDFDPAETDGVDISIVQQN